MVRQTSLLAYDEVVQKGKMGSRHRQILELMRDGYPRTDWEITKALGYNDPNVVRPRRNELVKLGFLREDGRTVCAETRKRVINWVVK